ncbi:MAG: hypothetical protein ACLTZV_09675 [Oscillospiraceae bacterium]
MLIDLLIRSLRLPRKGARRGCVGHAAVCRRGWSTGKHGGAAVRTGRAAGAALIPQRGAGQLLRLFAPLALVLYLDALVDGIQKGLQAVANVRYNTITSALDVALLFVLLRYGLGGYVFTFIAAHLVSFALSLRRLLRVTELRASAGAAVRTALLAPGRGRGGAADAAPGPERRSAARGR